MKILVTGGLGFIGSHIVDALITQGHEVVVVDNLTTGFKRNARLSAKFYEVNVCDEDLSIVFEKERPEIVYHQAAQTIVTSSVADPIFDLQANIGGSLNIILNCVRYNVKKIIYASSGGAVYGEPEYLPLDENHPINPISQYGISKHTVEHYLYLYNLQFGLNYTVLRYSNVYGPRQNSKAEAGVVAIFAGKILGGEQPTIFGSGDKTRDYIHVEDVVAANLAALEKGNNTIYNIGTGKETTDQGIFDTIAQILEYDNTPHYAPLRKGEIKRIYLDCTKASNELGWQPKIPLGEGLQSTMNHYRIRLGEASL